LHELQEDEEGLVRFKLSAVLLGSVEEGFDRHGMIARVDGHLREPKERMFLDSDGLVLVLAHDVLEDFLGRQRFACILLDSLKPHART
jgi:hypothetical protein